VRGPGWVALPRRVVVISRVAVTFTPCHGAPNLYSDHQAIAGAWLPATCDDCGARLTAALHADPAAESGLCAHWADTDPEQAR